MCSLKSKYFGVASLLGVLLLPAQASALVLSNEPLFLTGAVQPLVMLNLSKDHQLSYKAYNDYSDLDSDGTPETTYKDTIDYYGYFDSKTCYTYDASNNRFAPAANATGANSHYCSAQWSGNFLNWASMTRMDAVRKLLYGGRRLTDTTALTVLERQYLPTDAHAFAKYYNGSDIASLTPFTVPTTPATGTSSSNVTLGTGDRTFSTTLSVQMGDQIKAEFASDPTRWMVGWVKSISGSDVTIRVGEADSISGSGSTTSWTLTNLNSTGISMCNLTRGTTTGANRYSHSNTNPPLIRVARGNYALWGANERWQCYWRGEKANLQSGFNGGHNGSSNGNKPVLSGIMASAENPDQTAHGLGTGIAVGEYVARVEVCNASWIGRECKQYGSSYKPIGLLQTYGDNDQLLFGLMTGSFARNISGGVLRKNAGSFSSEVNSANGAFISTANGIVHNLDRIRLYGYDYNDGTYIGADSCTYQQTGLVLSGGSASQGSPANQGNCSSWGNPMSEIYVESLRYLGGNSATPAFTYGAGSKDATLGLTVATWSDPLSQATFCAPLNVLNFNASVSSYDGDQLAAAAADLGADAYASTNAVGASEGINGLTWFVGDSGVASNDLCTSKTVPLLGGASGLCPEAPTQSGTYLMSGVAHYARTNRIRSDFTVPSGQEYQDSLTVSTYGIALATNVPKIEVTVNGSKVTILPAYRLDRSSTGAGPFGGGTLVDFKIVTQTPTYGKFYVNWEDSEMGGDYDQDMWGTIEYTVSGSTITIRTDAVSASTANGQGFGYIISGTDRDGAHFHSGIYNFDYTDPTGVTGCNNCVVGDAPTSWTYNVTGGSAGLLKDPLWYAAKYGGFSDSNNNDQPDVVKEWDSINNNTGLPGSDGEPDNFFYVTNPLTLEKSLNTAFLKILRDSSASAVATNSSSLNTGSRIYQGRFSNNSWSGQVLSYRLDTNGDVLSAASAPPFWDAAELPYPEWDAGQQINTQVSAGSDTRLILTTGSAGGGVDFQYANLGAAQQLALDRDAFLAFDMCGPERVGYLRGHSTNEGAGTFTCSTTPFSAIPRFRGRNVGASGSVLGDVINSNPVYVGAPAAGYADGDHPGYSAFRLKFKSRKPVIYVGANDGMLHGIDASVNTLTNTPTPDSGKEVIAYVPSMVYTNLSWLTDSNYSANHRYFVDSSPMVADVCTASCTNASAVWKTMLVSGLGAGGKGFFALNVTNPDVSAQDTADTPQFSALQAANIVEWEFKDDVDIGLTFNNSPIKLNNGQANQIAKFENGRWGVVVGNGYNSTDGKAVLYVLFVQGPTGTGGTWQDGGVDYVKIVADAPLAKDNGLSTPVPFDADGDGLADTVYAGDLHGNMWKFDLSSATASLVFTAQDSLGNRQPIINSPEVTLHPTSGTMVLFGTGKFLEASDTTSTSVQSFYGIHDTGVTVSGRSELIPQDVSTTTLPRDTVTPGCGTALLPACPTTPKGWYMDLPTSGERTTGTARLVSGNIFFNTFIPSVSPCEFGGTGWLMTLNYLTGELPFPGIFDTNNDGKIDSNDAPVAGAQIGAALGGTTLISGNAGSTVGVGISSLTSGKTKPTLINFGAGSRGRITWREIVQ